MQNVDKVLVKQNIQCMLLQSTGSFGCLLTSIKNSNGIYFIFGLILSWELQ